MTNEQLEEIEQRLATGIYSSRAAADISNLMAEVSQLQQDIEILRKDHKEKLDAIFAMVRSMKYSIDNYLGSLERYSARR